MSTHDKPRYPDKQDRLYLCLWQIGGKFRERTAGLEKRKKAQAEAEESKGDASESQHQQVNTCETNHV